LYNDYKGRILREWREIRVSHPDAQDILALVHVEAESVTLSLLDRAYAVEELGITGRNQLTRPAGEADPPVPLALWVLLVHAKGNETVRLEDVMSEGGDA